MPVDRLLVERVDLGRLGGSAGGDDLRGERVDRCLETPGQKDRRSLAREGAGHRAADRAPCSVDHRDLVFENHFVSFPWRVLASAAAWVPSKRQTRGRRESGRRPTAQFATRPVSIRERADAQERRDEKVER